MLHHIVLFYDSKTFDPGTGSVVWSCDLYKASESRKTLEAIITGWFLNRSMQA